MNIDNIHIKIANNSDIEVLCEFEELTHITEPDIWISEFNKNNCKKKLSSFDLDNLVNNKIILAILDQKVIGRCDLIILQSLFGFDKTGYIDWIYTLINYRGYGIGKKMIMAAEEYFKTQGVNSYYLFTASNKQATEFYHRQDSFQFSQKEVAEKELN